PAPNTAPASTSPLLQNFMRRSFSRGRRQHMGRKPSRAGPLTARQHSLPSPSLVSMEVRVRLFAGLRERAGSDVVELDLPDGALVADALERLGDVTDGVPVVMAVNHEYAGADVSLHQGDEVALIPPVSGGSVGSLHVRVTDEPLALEPLLERV